MSSIIQNFNHSKRCITKISLRRFSSGQSNAIESEKMQAKRVVLSQWKLINQLKKYFSKISTSNKIIFENALNKEFAHFLQKIQPSVYGTEIIRYFENVTLPNKSAINEENRSSGIISIPNVLNGLIKIRNEEKSVEEVVPKWKKTAKISKESVACRTEHLLSLINSANSDETLITRIEHFNIHLKQYQEAKHTAVKEGAIRNLLKIRKNRLNEEIQSTLNEALVLLGYVNPVPGSGVRILSIDGGGVRGILVIEMLKKLEELYGKSVHEMFDFICGVSTGAIIASLIGVKNCTLDEISKIYEDLSTQIFNQSTLKGTSNLVWSHSYYDTALWEKLLKQQIGEETLISTNRKTKCPKLCALSAVVNQSRLSAYLFRNYSLPCRVQSQYMGGHDHKVWEAVRASAAAPTYFEEFKLGNMLHQDGGVLYNNPTAVAIHEAKLLWPSTPIQCVISFGTGRNNPYSLNTSIEQTPISNSSWKNKLFAIIESATDTEGVHTMLSDLLPGDVYYRFNPYLTDMLNMAEIDPQKLEQLKRDAVMYLRRNEDKICAAASALNTKKGVVQKVKDWVNLQCDIYG